jgi:cytochrome c oxidase subunit 2
MKNSSSAARTAVLAFGAVLLPRLAEALPFWMKLPSGESSFSGEIDGIFNLILWITGVIFVIVEALLVIFVIRYRHREGRRARYTHGNNRVEVIWTIVPAVICVVLALVSRRVWAEIKQRMPEDAMQIEVTAEQFAWNIRYPGPDGKFGTPDDIVTLNQLHFPVGQKVVVSLHSKDVIHSFFLPEFRVKQDAVPGMTTKVWFDAAHVGHWEIACAELCGLGHYRMKGFLTADSKEDFDKWLAEQAGQTPPPASSVGGPAPTPAAAPSSQAPPAPGVSPPPDGKAAAPPSDRASSANIPQEAKTSS